jgi:hypothetical protein
VALRPSASHLRKLIHFRMKKREINELFSATEQKTFLHLIHCPKPHFQRYSNTQNSALELSEMLIIFLEVEKKKIATGHTSITLTFLGTRTSPEPLATCPTSQCLTFRLSNSPWKLSTSSFATAMSIPPAVSFASPSSSG